MSDAIGTLQALGSIVPARSSDTKPALPSEVLDRTGEKAQESAALLDAARQFESLFLNMLLKSMRATVPREGPWGDSSELKMYEELRDEELSKQMSQAGGIGLAPVIARQLGGDAKALGTLRGALHAARDAGRRNMVLDGARASGVAAPSSLSGIPESHAVDPTPPEKDESE